jgi:hypothetical protein
MACMIDQLSGNRGYFLATGRVIFHHFGRKLPGGIRLQLILGEAGNGDFILAFAMNAGRDLLVGQSR